MRRTRTLWVLAAFFALSVAFTWPLTPHFSDSIPSDLGDPLLNATILGWDASRLPHALTGLWDAPIFYPYRNTLTFSEHLLGIAVFVAPIYWATGNPLVAYNAAFLLSFVLAGIGMFVLVRDLTGRDEAALVGGLVFAFMPARLGQIGHLQVLMSGWMPLALWALHRFVATTARRWLAAFISFTILQCLSNNYFVYFFALPAAIVCATGISTAPPDRRRRLIRGVIAAAALVVVAMLPIAATYFAARRAYGLKRGPGDVSYFGADLAAYLHGNEAVSPPLALWRHLPFASKPAGSEGELFVGALAFVLAALGLWIAIRRRPASMFAPARLYAMVFAGAVLLSLGMRPTAWGIRLPIGGIYEALFTVVPGFDGLRVPARMSVVTDLAVAVLAGLGAAGLVERRRRAIRWAMTTAMAAAILLEGYGAPIPLAFLGSEGRADRAAYTWVRDHAEGAILELPTEELGPILQSYRYEYETLFHHRSIVNGASGYDSALHTFLGNAASPLAELSQIDQGLRLLRGIGVLTIVVHPHGYPREEFGSAVVTAIKTNPQVVRQTTFPGIEVFNLAPFADAERPEQAAGRSAGAMTDAAVKEIPRADFVAAVSHAPERLRFALDGNIDSRWTANKPQEGDEAIDLTFKQPHDIARVRLLTRSFGDYPRSLQVEGADDEGARQTLYSGSVVFQFGEGLIREPIRAPIDVWLRPNHTRRLRLLQTGSGRRFWSIHELTVWEARP